ncbi:MAG: FprA family A-type flavoprotein [Promethearchaeati archaeon]
MHKEIVDGVHYVGVDDHHTELFENIWRIPYGISYNSYLIVDEKIAIIDLVKEPWAEKWLNNIREIIDPSEIDYIIMNHMEPDHTGALPELARIAQNATMVYTDRAADIQESFYNVELEEHTVDDLEEISLGNKTLQFVHAQFLHWPETMLTYLKEDRVLFACDAFGSYGALNGKIFDSDWNLNVIEEESRRYLSSIITSYLRFIQRGIEKVRDLGIEIDVIAPSHGPIYNEKPEWIIQKYDEWSSPELEDNVAIVYGSMYGYTQRLAVKLKKQLLEQDVEVNMHNASYSDMSKILVDAMRAGVLVIGLPTYDAFPFPPIWSFLNEVEGKRLPKRPIGLFGTYGWGGGGVRKTKKKLEDMRFNILEPVIRVQGLPSDAESAQTKKLADAIKAHLENK